MLLCGYIKYMEIAVAQMQNRWMSEVVMNQYIYVTSLFNESGKSECIAGLIFAENIVEAMKRLEEFVGETHLVEVQKLALIDEGPVIEFSSSFIKTLKELKKNYLDLDGFKELNERLEW